MTASPKPIPRDSYDSERAVASPGPMVNGGTWLDTKGQPIQAHGGGLLQHGDAWYWYGENKDGPTRSKINAHGDQVARIDFRGVSGYRSSDLVNWTPLGDVLTAVPELEYHDLHPTRVVERPKVVFNRTTGKFVMWLHVDFYDYRLAAAGVAVADHPEGPFRYLGSTRPHGRDCRDQTVFVDDDQRAYHLCSTDMNATLLLSELTDDYLGFTGRYRLLFEGRCMEAHAITKRDGRYLYLASGCTGWDPNAARAAFTDSLWGDWIETGNPCVGPDAETTYQAQSTFLQTLPDGRLLAMFDRWQRQDLRTSSYVWLEAQVNASSGNMTIPWTAEPPCLLESPHGEAAAR